MGQSLASVALAGCGKKEAPLTKANAPITQQAEPEKAAKNPSVGENKPEEQLKPTKASPVTIANPIIELITIEGNYRTVDYVIRRQLAMNPGDPFDIGDIKLSLERIQALRIIDSVRIGIELPDHLPGGKAHPDYKDSVNIVVTVQAPKKVTIEAAIRAELGKPEGELTKADLEKVTRLNLHGNQLTDVKGLERLTQLKNLWLKDNPDLTKARIDELQKALPKCKIESNPTK
jgi:outer membrane protein assembly factor BamA